MTRATTIRLLIISALLLGSVALGIYAWLHPNPQLEEQVQR